MAASRNGLNETAGGQGFEISKLPSSPLIFNLRHGKYNMRFIADLHIHSRFSRATSKNITINNLVKYAKIKGLDIIGTGDFTHPTWLKILKENLRDEGCGILKSREGFNFILSTEVSNIYKEKGKIRKIHNIILAPDFETVEQINSWLSKKGRLDYDGRPVFGFSCPELVENLIGISKRIMIIPSHCLTPWFSVFGSKSGFDSVEECFHDQAKHIYALETGLSADPPMIWRVSKWDGFALVSFSDAHSFWPWRIGREATIFELERLTYENLTNAIITKNGLIGTIEVDPNYGKYHYDGHRECGVCLPPKLSKKYHNVCPVCGKPLTIGVLHRVEELADRPEGYRPKNAKMFIRLLPLSEIISSVMNIGITSQTVWQIYNRLISAAGSELCVLLTYDISKIEDIANKKIAQIIDEMRKGRIEIKPGYDGVYGKLVLR